MCIHPFIHPMHAGVDDVATNSRILCTHAREPMGGRSPSASFAQTRGAAFKPSFAVESRLAGAGARAIPGGRRGDADAGKGRERGR